MKDSWLFFFIVFSLVAHSSAENIQGLDYMTTYMPIGKLSEISRFSPANRILRSDKLSFIDPRIGLKSARVDRLSGNNLPLHLSYLDSNQRNKLAFLLQEASSNLSMGTGEILVVSGNNINGCGRDVRLVVLSDGIFRRLAQGLKNFQSNPITYLHSNGRISLEVSIDESKICPCQNYGLDGLYGANICTDKSLKFDTIGQSLVNFFRGSDKE